MKQNNTAACSSGFSLEDNDAGVTSMNPKQGHCISHARMETGRDEMNFAEFPLAALTNRPQTGNGSLVFEDSVQDKSLGGPVKRRLVVSPSVEYGLPASLDDEVILGLVQLSKAGGFCDRKLAFHPTEFFRILGWREEGRSYTRLEKSLKRWLGVTLYYHNAWRDKARDVWVDKHFHVLEEVTIRRPRKAGKANRPEDGHGVWSATWNEVVFQSFEAGYLRKLDMNLYRGLHLAASKRMYRFLDKRFYHRKRLVFDLRTFACEHIAFGRSDDNSQLKRRLNPAIDELERAGFLEPVPIRTRYRKICRGKWEVGFSKAASPRSVRTEGSNELQTTLMDIGVWESVASELTRKYTESSIRAILDEFKQLLNTGKAPALSNPPGLLVAWISERGVTESKSQERRTCTEEAHTSARRRRKATCQESMEDAFVVRACKYVESLSARELRLLEAEALAQAEPHLKEGYQRSLDAGSKELQGEYCSATITFPL
jgi:hypothetical protein